MTEEVSLTSREPNSQYMDAHISNHVTVHLSASYVISVLLK